MSAGGLERPISPLDTERLQREIDDYQSNLDTQCEALYQLAGQARSKGFDLSDQVEIPRAIDLADRAEKLLVDYLIAPEYGFEDPIPIAEDIRTLLKEKDSREDAAIDMAVKVAIQMHDRTADVQKSIDTGLRVGLKLKIIVHGRLIKNNLVYINK